MLQKKRPLYLNLRQISLPLSGWVSILHRLSGVMLFFSLPLLLWGLELSLKDPGRVDWLFAGAYLQVKVLLLLLGWAFFHHLFAGLRVLALDLDWGTERAAAKKSSLAVLVLSLTLTILLALRLW